MSKRGGAGELAGLSFDNIVAGSRKRAREEDGTANASPSTSTSTPNKASNAPKESVQDVMALGHKFMHILYHTIDPTDEWPIANYFLELPSQKQYPDYYQLIKKPMAFEPIKKKCAQGGYSSYEELKHDCETVCNNAKRYNQKGSLLWNKAKGIHQLIRTTFDDLIAEANNGGLLPIQPIKYNNSSSSSSSTTTPTTTTSRPKITIRAPKRTESDVKPQESISQPVPTKDQGKVDDDDEEDNEEEDEEDEVTEGGDANKSTSTIIKLRKNGKIDKRTQAPKRGAQIHSKFKKAYNKILKLKGEQGQFLSEYFMILPSKTDYPDYYQLIKNPICLKMVEEKIGKKKYKNFLGLVEDLRLICENALFYNLETSDVAVDAFQLRNWVERTLIPSYIADGFTLDKDDNRTAVLPPDEATIQSMSKSSETYKILMSRRAGVKDSMQDGDEDGADEADGDISVEKKIPTGEPPSKKLKLKVGPRPSIQKDGSAPSTSIPTLNNQLEVNQGSSSPLTSLPSSSGPQTKGPEVPIPSMNKPLTSNTTNHLMGPPKLTPSLSRSRKSNQDLNSGIPKSSTPMASRLSQQNQNNQFSTPNSHLNSPADLSTNNNAFNNQNYFSQYTSNPQIQALIKKQQKEEELQKRVEKKIEEDKLRTPVSKVNIWSIPTVRGIKREAVVPVIWVEEVKGNEGKLKDLDRNLLKNDFVRQHSVRVNKESKKVRIRFGVRGVRDVTKYEEERERRELRRIGNGIDDSIKNDDEDVELIKLKGKSFPFEFETKIWFNGKSIPGQWKNLNNSPSSNSKSKTRSSNPSQDTTTMEKETESETISQKSTSSSICELTLDLPGSSSSLTPITSLLEIEINPPPPNVGLELIANEPLERPAIKPKGRWGWRGDEKAENEREMARELVEMGDRYRIWFVR